MPIYSRGLKPPHAHRAAHMSGTAAVEFALVFPLLLFVVFGAIELGAALYDKSVLTNASREAARFGVLLQATPPTTKAQVISLITPVVTTYSQNQLVTFGSTSTPQVDVVFTNSNSGSPLQVKLSYTFNGLVLGPLIAPFSGPLQINTTTTMKFE
ncbi:TadE/TadG family type IV pilus assembly protein [Cupriavidus basilensis]|uniref:TadE/TadG family type IV pilus assembly protein n=1 Tax=Cupriavidus basilensis TaxID=68895 RepID=UPI0020A63573|nr:TadE/TadG family type IV pilus assembly protein [Cupriavidus basilensis]MCP3023399.1 pilus assembly protein [Cupriavidus basilensis]